MVERHMIRNSMNELVKDSVNEKISATASDGINYFTQFYNLYAIISGGYRVNSVRATQFRQWATSVLREFAIRGYLLDSKPMKNGMKYLILHQKRKTKGFPSALNVFTTE